MTYRYWAAKGARRKKVREYEAKGDRVRWWNNARDTENVSAEKDKKEKNRPRCGEWVRREARVRDGHRKTTRVGDEKKGKKKVREREKNGEGRTRFDRETVVCTSMHWTMPGRWWWRPTNEESEKSGGKARKEGRVSSSCNAIDPVAVHHVDTILVRSFQIAGVVGVGFCAITSIAGPTRTHARTHAHTRAWGAVWAWATLYTQVAREQSEVDEWRARCETARSVHYILGARSFEDAMPIARNRTIALVDRIDEIYTVERQRKLTTFSKLPLNLLESVCTKAWESNGLSKIGSFEISDFTSVRVVGHIRKSSRDAPWRYLCCYSLGKVDKL